MTRVRIDLDNAELHVIVKLINRQVCTGFDTPADKVNAQSVLSKIGHGLTVDKSVD